MRRGQDWHRCGYSSPILCWRWGIFANGYDVQHLFVAAENGVHGHVLGAGGDVLGGGEMGEEGGDVG